MVNNLLGKRSAGKLHAAFDEAGAGNVNMGIFGLRPNMKIMDKLPSPKEARQFSTLPLVTHGKVIKSGEIWAGRPAKFFKKMSNEEVKRIAQSAQNYIMLMKEYKN